MNDQLNDFWPISTEAVDAFALRVLDMACAQALGTDIRPEDIEANTHRRVFPPYSTDPTATRLLEDEVERRGLQHQYINKLFHICHMFEQSGSLDFIWVFLRATPEQRARAFVEVTKQT